MTAKASNAGFVNFHVTELISGKFDIAKLTQGFVLLVTNGVNGKEEPLERLSTVSANLDLNDEAIPLVSIDPQLSFKYCNW